MNLAQAGDVAGNEQLTDSLRMLRVGAEVGLIRRLRIGTYLASNRTTVEFQDAVAHEIGRRVGHDVEFVVETSYDSYLDDLNDVSFVCGLAHIVLERQGHAPSMPIAAPVLAGRRYGGRPIYFSDVIARRDSSIRSFTDLRGRSWAYNEPLSQSGYGVTRYHLAKLGEVSGFFGQTVRAGFHAAAIRMVAAGEVDGAAIDSHVLAIELREHPELADVIDIVDVLGPSTIQPVVVSRRISPELRNLMSTSLTSLADDLPSVFASAMVERFVVVGANAYDDIRRMVSYCESVGFLDLQ